MAQTARRTLLFDFKMPDCKNEAPTNVADEEKGIIVKESDIKRLDSYPRFKTAEEKHSYAQQSVAAAQYEYAVYLESTDKGQQSKAKRDLLAKQSTELYLRAAVGGDERAQLALARRLAAGCGCSVDRAKSRNWYEIAAKSGNADAKISLAQMLSQSSDERDRQRALDLLQEMVVVDGSGVESIANREAVRLLILNAIEGQNPASLRAFKILCQPSRLDFYRYV